MQNILADLVAHFFKLNMDQSKYAAVFKLPNY